MWSDVVITVSGMWLRRDVKAAYVFTRVFIKEKGLGGLDPKLVKKRWGNLCQKYKVRSIFLDHNFAPVD